MSTVVVAGGGLAGLTAALRLAERGYGVTLYERQPILGGNVASRPVIDDVKYDVYPHMYLTWYHNFWKLVGDVTGVPREDLFVPMSNIKRLSKGEFPRFTALTDTYSPLHALQNLFSGVAPPADLFLFMYASVDLLAEHMSPTVLLDNLSVNGFLHARPYMTERAAELFDTWITLVWSIPSYLASAADYQTFLKHGYAEPVPALWLLRGAAEDRIIEPIRVALEAAGAEIHLSTTVTGVSCSDGRIREITLRRDGKEWTEPIDDLVLAVPPPALSHLVRTGPPGRRIVDAEPMLAEVARLRTEAMPMVHVAFTSKLPDIPAEPVSLVGAKYGLAFTDVSQSRDDLPGSPDRTILALSSSDRYGLPGTDPRDDAMAMIRELAAYVPAFEAGNAWGTSADIDWDQTSVDLNVDTRLFINETGCDIWRPPVRCDALSNLHLAGDYCDNHIGLTCIEAGVITGLNAAQSVIECRGVGAPVDIIRPQDFPALLFAWLRVAWAPYAAAAKMWSSSRDLCGDVARRLGAGRSALGYLFGATPKRRQR
jgi:predicted NAD/FAD-dependent oxidoreductase